MDTLCRSTWRDRWDLVMGNSTNSNELKERITMNIRWLYAALITAAAAFCVVVATGNAAVLRKHGTTIAEQSKKRLPAHHDLWIRIGRCEQPGRGYKGIYWSHPGPTYQGGLGFYHGTWDAFKVKGMPDNAGDATWRQQMWVANRLYARYGTSPWGCG